MEHITFKQTTTHLKKKKEREKEREKKQKIIK